ncbi:MAG: hypothetical protein ACYC77_11770 [Coriobacteriia bacterium]
MTTLANSVTPLQRLERLMPQTGMRTQLISAAAIWLVGSSILLVRGIGYVSMSYWHAWVVAAGLALGVLKSRLLLERVATKAVMRIRLRGRASFLGFYSLRSWALIALMMGGGITLRQLVVYPSPVGAGIMGAVYVGIGTALFLADRVFWHAVFRRPRATA